MIVSNQNQLNKLNILTLQNDSTLKEVLKEADVKTILSQNKEINLSTVLKSLFKGVGDTKQSNETILKLLRNTTISKDLGSFTSNLQQLLKSLPNNETTKNIRVFLQNFLMNIDKAGNTNIKEQFSKSGVFLESKLAQQTTTPSQNNQSNILNDMKTQLLKTKANLESLVLAPRVKENINTNETLKLVDKILSQLTKSETLNPSQIKNSLNNIKAEIQNQTILSNKGETLNELDRLISKVPSNTLSNSNILTELKTTLTKVQTLVQNQIQQAQNSQIPKEQLNSANELVKQIDKILSQINKSEPISNGFIKELLTNAKSQIENLSQFISKNQIQSPQMQNSQMQSTSSQLFALKAQMQNILKEPMNVNEVIKQIDKVLTQINNLESNSNITLKSNNPIFQESKSLLTNIQNQLSNLSKENPSINELSKQIDTLISKMNKNEPVLLNDIKTVINKIKTEIQTQQNLPNRLETLNQLDKLIEKTTIESNRFVQQNTQILKTDSPIFNDIKTVLTKIQTQFQTYLQSQYQNQNIDDIKVNLQALKDNDSTESIKQIDKLLNQIDYHQLYSLANNSNNIYIPFLWDLLEDGSIDIKKSDNDKFYCIIDLTLKELGNVDIHLLMFNQENLDISIFVEKDETKQLIRQKLSSLKQALFSSDIKLESISVSSKIVEKDTNKEDVYKQDDDINFGLNIKV